MKTDSHLPQFADLMSEYVNFISGIGKCDYITPHIPELFRQVLYESWRSAVG